MTTDIQTRPSPAHSTGATPSSALGTTVELRCPRCKSTLSRAEVVTQVLQASRAGTLPRNDAELHMVAVAPSNRSRDDVRAETLAAIASGELQALHAEIGDSAQPVASTKRATVITQMASASR